MEVTEAYLKDFATNIQAEPEELPMNGREALGSNGTAIDDPDRTSLNIAYEDEYEQYWHAKEGVAKRRTIVIPMRNSKPYGDKLYIFQGLKRAPDLAEWWRKKNNIQTEPTSE